MFIKSYDAAVNFLSENAPALPIEPGKTNNFFQWAEDMSLFVGFIYGVDPENALEDIVEAVKEIQGYED